MMVLSNVGAGGWDSATSLWLVELWPTKNSAILQANQFMYGMGSILAPLLAAPFLHGIKSEVLVGNETRFLTLEDRITSLSIPFGVNGLLQGIGKLSFFSFNLQHSSKLITFNQLLLFYSSCHIFLDVLCISLQSITRGL